MQTSCLVLLLTTSLALAQPPAIEWSHQWDVHEYWDACETVRQVPDGGYIAMGWTDYSLAPDAYILRTNPGGGQIWAVTLGEIMPLDYVVSGELTADAGCVITGYREPVEMEQTDLWLVRLSPSGDVLWNRSYGGAYNEGGHCVIETFDGGFAVAGMKQDSAIWSQGWLIKTDASGDTQWTRTIGADLSHIRQTSDGGFLLSRDGNQLVKTDANGNILWTRSGYDGTIRAFELTSDGGIVAAGGSDDFWLAKLNEEGFPIWSRTFGGAGEDRCSDVQQTMDEGFILAGVWDFDFGAYPGGGEAWLLKTDALGDSLWSIVNGSWGLDEWKSVRQTFDGGYIVGGYYNYWYPADFWLMKTTAEVACTGYVTLLSAGPPDWDYQLHWSGGAVHQFVFHDVCSGTVGSVSGEAAAQGWTAASWPDRVAFVSPNPLTSGAIGVFTLTHPWCSDSVIWVVGGNQGHIEGPLPVELLSFAAVEGDRQVTLQWATASETDNDYFEIRRDARLVAQAESEGSSTTGHEYTWTDRGLENGITYVYTLIAVDMSGVQEEIGVLNAIPRAGAPIVAEYELMQNYPNPFNASTEISYAIAEAGHVTLTVFNAMGQEAATLVDAEQTAAAYTVTFDASALPTGIYVCRLNADAFVATRKMILLR